MSFCFRDPTPPPALKPVTSIRFISTPLFLNLYNNMQPIDCVQYEIGLYVMPPEESPKIMIWLDVAMTKTSRRTLYDVGKSWCLDGLGYSISLDCHWKYEDIVK